MERKWISALCCLFLREFAFVWSLPDRGMRWTLWFWTAKSARRLRFPRGMCRLPFMYWLGFNSELLRGCDLWESHYGLDRRIALREWWYLRLQRKLHRTAIASATTASSAASPTTAATSPRAGSCMSASQPQFI